MMRKINNIVIHCSAGFSDLKAVQKYWKETLGWKSPGYHYFIYESGEIVNLSPISKITNGVKNHNSDSVHICYQGGVDKKTGKAKDTRTNEQKESILKCINEVLLELKKFQDLNSIRIIGHRDFSTDVNNNDFIDSWERIKECPSFEVIPEYRWITVNKVNQNDKYLPK